jgi:peptide/nickel transport system permease protein
VTRGASRPGRGELSTAAAALVLAAIAACAAAPSALAPYEPHAQEIALRLTPPWALDGGSAAFVLGTDQLGRDILSRIVYGARITVVVALAALVISGSVGVAIGLLAGYHGRRVDDWLMRVADVQLSIPYVLLAIAIIAVIGATTGNVILVLALHGWVAYARVVRAQTLALRDREFVVANRALGASDWRILSRHVWPNVVGGVVVVGSLELPGMIMLESSLSFLGLGIQPPTVSWGAMLADGRTHLLGGAWWVVTFPGLAITLTVLSVSVLADRLRDWLGASARIRT